MPVEVPRRVAVPTVDAAERELLEATRGYVRFLEGKVRRDDSTAVFYEKMGRDVLEQLTATEPRFRGVQMAATVGNIALPADYHAPH